ncbi:integrase family protein [Acetobacter orientalis]|uniref:Integrase family protein n=1 Tax=Acetobacter orientalis TaxID=146474 RepID=A0A2Z5ZD04_9PROT|nr:integrase family protein [Acetobacter orientalis]
MTATIAHFQQPASASHFAAVVFTPCMTTPPVRATYTCSNIAHLPHQSRTAPAKLPL